MTTYLLFNGALGQFMPNHRTSDKAQALRWLRGCRSFVQVVRDNATTFGEVVARGGDVCRKCGALSSAQEHPTEPDDCSSCRAQGQKGGVA